MTKATRIAFAALFLISCAGSDPPAPDENWSLEMTVDGVGLDGEVTFAVPAVLAAGERERLAQLFAGLEDFDRAGEREVSIAIAAGDTVLRATVRTDDAGVPEVMDRVQSFIVDASLSPGASLALCRPIGWCDELPGNCWCICICGCKCIYWE